MSLTVRNDAAVVGDAQQGQINQAREICRDLTQHYTLTLHAMRGFAVLHVSVGEHDAPDRAATLHSGRLADTLGYLRVLRDIHDDRVTIFGHVSCDNLAVQDRVAIARESTRMLDGDSCPFNTLRVEVSKQGHFYISIEGRLVSSTSNARECLCALRALADLFHGNLLKLNRQLFR